MCNQGPPPPFLLRPPGKLNMSPPLQLMFVQLYKGSNSCLKHQNSDLELVRLLFSLIFSSFWKSFKWTRENTAVGLGYDPWPYTDHPV